MLASPPAPALERQRPQPDVMMTRTPNRRLLALALAAAMAPAMPAMAQSGTPFSLGGLQPDAPPAGSFTVSDIRVDGL